MTEQFTILSRIKKLLALTEDRGATPEEAAAAAAKAQSLLFEHNLSMASVDSHEIGAKVESIENIDVNMDANARTITWKRSLLFIVAKCNFCKGVYKPGSTIMHVIGKPSNVEIVQYMAEHIGREIERLAKLHSKTTLGSKAAFVNSFCRGAVVTIQDRLKAQMVQNEHASAACTALVVQSKGALDLAVKSFYPVLVSARSSGRVSNYSGYEAGREAGKNIGLHKGVGERPGQRQLTY